MMADLALKGILAHLTGDFLLQNDWMADNKGSLRHPAAWVHGGIHCLLLALFFPLPAAAGLALVHVLIDTRSPLRWWSRVYGKSMSDPLAAARGLWEDQVLHIVIIAAVAWALVR